MMLCEPRTRYWSMKIWEKMGITIPGNDQRQARQHDEGERPLGASQPPSSRG